MRSWGVAARSWKGENGGSILDRRQHKFKEAHLQGKNKRYRDEQAAKHTCEQTKLAFFKDHVAYDMLATQNN